MFACFVLGLVSSVPSQEIGWEERLQNDPFCVELDVEALTQCVLVGVFQVKLGWPFPLWCSSLILCMPQGYRNRHSHFKVRYYTKQPNLGSVFMLTLWFGIFIPHLHDTTGYQTGCTTGLTTGCIV